MIAAVQALRALAAISVALVHFSLVRLIVTGHANDPIPLFWLAAGVDLFFVISGFVMVHSSEALFASPGASRIFLVRRIARIAPLYWLTTGIWILIIQPPFDWTELLRSLLFIPYRGSDGAIHPVNGIGWTLNYEMLFYVLFAIAINWRRGIAVLGVSALLGCAALFGLLAQPQWVPLKFWCDPIVLEFALGMLIALLYRREFAIPLAIRIVMVVGALIAAWLSTPYFVSYRLLGWGVPAALIAAAALLGDRRVKPGPIMSPVVTLGDASYSIYLFQAMVIGLVGKAWGPALYDFPVVPILAVCFVAMIALSIAVFQFFERPVTRILRRLFDEQLLTLMHAQCSRGRSTIAPSDAF
jgi:peptidoglycan/LPS O-acetylase OafA/YrhL